jgi:abortive infection bacteriophage resistance protein
MAGFSYSIGCMREYLNITELKTVLESRGLNLDRDAPLDDFLSLVGHHRLQPYYKAYSDPNKNFENGIAATDVLRLYLFDRRLRLLLLGPLEKTEVALRSLIVKEAGDFLRKQDHGVKGPLNLFDPRLYHPIGKKKKPKLEKLTEACQADAKKKWLQRQPYVSGEITSGKLTEQDITRRFDNYFKDLDAWELLQSISFGPLSLVYKLLRSEISNPIATRFGLHRDVFASMLFTLKTLRNACAHHEPMWNWDRAWAQINFPEKYREDAKIAAGNKTKIYACCAALHILLSVLSSGRSSWYRRLKKLINEFDTLDATSMGFPADWQTMPFWCVADVRQLERIRFVRAKIRAETTIP